MTPEERRRVGRVIKARLVELDLSVAEFAEKAGVHESTVRRVIAGQTWPHETTRRRLAEALGWPVGELPRRALDRSPLSAFTTAELIAELCDRMARDANIRALRALGA